MRVLTITALLCAAFVLSACVTAAPAVEVAEPWVRAAVVTGAQAEGEQAMSMGGTSAAYMTIVNRGGAADRLLSASTTVAETVELHETTMNGNVMQMRPVTGGIEVPANGQVELAPGGLHVMLIGLQRDLAAGETVELTLTFQRAGTVTVTAPVRQP